MDPVSFLFSLPLFPPLSLSSHLYLNTNGGLLKRNCPQNARVPVVFHTQGACRTSRTRVESVCRELLAPVPRFQGYRLLLVWVGFTWHDAARLWEVFMAADFKSSIRRFGPQHMLSYELMTCNFYFRYTDLFPCWVALICILYRCLLLTLNPDFLFSFVAFLWNLRDPTRDI